MPRGSGPTPGRRESPTSWDGDDNAMGGRLHAERAREHLLDPGRRESVAGVDNGTIPLPPAGPDMIRASRFALPASGFPVLLVALVLSGTAQAQDRSLRRLDGYIEKAMGEWSTPGLSIAIVRNDSLIYSKGYGLRELGRPDRVDDRTLFAIGSQTKAFTGVALAMLADQGAINLDDPVTKHLTGFRLADPCLTTQISVRDLVTHRSGLPGNNLIFWGTNLSRKQIVERLRFLQPTAGLRSRYQYQNLMYITAGEIIPAVTGGTWDEFVRARIFGPLGMTSSETSVAALLRSGKPNVATPHARYSGRLAPVPWLNLDNAGPAGSIVSNAVEMAQWFRFQLGNGSLG